MKTVTYDLPNLYGDHHVLEVRRILLEISGVVDVYASSAFRMVEVTYDPALTNDLDIAVKLDESGYLGEWSMPMEAGASTYLGDRSRSYFRHTAVYETTLDNCSTPAGGFLCAWLWSSVTESRSLGAERIHCHLLVLAARDRRGAGPHGGRGFQPDWDHGRKRFGCRRQKSSARHVRQ